MPQTPLRILGGLNRFKPARREDDSQEEGAPAPSVKRPRVGSASRLGLDPGQVLALIDANKFYCACERVFQPELRGRPLVVLTNNDGCVAALTPEAKALGVKRGMPAFRLRPLIERGELEWRSSNYELYGSISSRIARIVEGVAPRIERYSIDENFADLTGLPGDPTETAREIKRRIYAWQRIPTCVGVANTKTLAKLANHLAKDWPVFGGVLNWLELSPERREKAMSITPAAEVWGIGGRTLEALSALGVRSVLDFFRMDPAFIRARWGVVLERTWRELHGVPCIPFEEKPAPRAQIIRSRSFGAPVKDADALVSAVSMHMNEAALVLRAQQGVAGMAGVLFHTNFFRPDLPQHSAEQVLTLPRPTNDTLELTAIALNLVRRHFRAGCAYQKAGVILADIRPEAGAEGAVETEAGRQWSLFTEEELTGSPRRRALMETWDGLVRRWGKDVLAPASTKLAQGWEMRRGHLSRCCTTRGEELLRVGDERFLRDGPSGRKDEDDEEDEEDE